MGDAESVGCYLCAVDAPYIIKQLEKRPNSKEFGDSRRGDGGVNENRKRPCSFGATQSRSRPFCFLPSTITGSTMSFRPYFGGRLSEDAAQMIVDQVASQSPRTLPSLCRVSHSFYNLSLKPIYRRIVINSDRTFHQTVELLERLVAEIKFGKHVRDIHILSDSASAKDYFKIPNLLEQLIPKLILLQDFR